MQANDIDKPTNAESCALSPGLTIFQNRMQYLMNIGDWEEASCQKEACFPINPENGSGWMAAGAKAFQIGDYVTAIACLKNAWEIVVEHPHAQGRVGTANYQQPENAGELLVAQGAASDAALLMLGVSYLNLGHPAAAMLVLERVAARVEVRLPLAQAWRGADRGDLGEALFLSAIKERVRDCHWAIVWLSELLIEQERFSDLQLMVKPWLTETDIALAARAVMAELALLHGQNELVCDFLPLGMPGNWGHAFSMQARALLEAHMRTHGLVSLPRVPHPFPGSTLGVSCKSLNRAGRLAHQMLDYLGLRWWADQYGLVAETPDWIGHYLFELSDPLPTGRRVAVRMGGPSLEKEVSKYGAAALAGRDLYSVGGLTGQWGPELAHKARALFCWRPVWQESMAPFIDYLRRDADTVVAVHIRITDLAVDTSKLGWYREWLDGLLPTLQRPIVYLASDDLDAATSAFAEYSPRVATDFEQRTLGLDWLYDFYALCHADVVAGSVGTFGAMACVLNTRATAFFKLSESGLETFSPLQEL